MTDNALTHFKQPTLLYDGTCPMCLSMMNALRFLGLNAGVQALSWQDALQANPALGDSRLAEQIRREILLVLPESASLLRGVDVLSWLLGRKNTTRWLGGLLKVPGISGFTVWLYETLALNRRLVTPPQHPEVACSCDPPQSLRLRLRLYGLLLAVSLLGLIAFSCALAATYQTRAIAIVFYLLISMGSGWLLAYAGLALWLRSQFRLYFQQSLVVMAVGGLWLLVSAILLESVHLALHAEFPFSVSFVSVLVLNLHTAIMLFSTIRRVRALRLSPVLPWLWLALYFGGYLLSLNRFF
jgi:predicted DCC family thiol-disulfide oxidoreductase YuxK